MLGRVKHERDDLKIEVVKVNLIQKLNLKFLHIIGFWHFKLEMSDQ